MQQSSSQQPRFVFDANNRPYRSVMVRSANGGPLTKRLIPAGRLDGQGPRIFKIAANGTTFVRQAVPTNRTPTSTDRNSVTDTPPVIDFEADKTDMPTTTQQSGPTRVAYRHIDSNNELMYVNGQRVVRRPIRIVPKNGVYGSSGFQRYANIVSRNGRIVPFRPVYHGGVNRRPLEFEESEEEAISRAIEQEEARMHQEANPHYYDADFSRIEANLVKRAQSTARELEITRFSKLTSYQSRAVMPSEIDCKVKQIVQKMMHDPSPTALNSGDPDDIIDAKMTLTSVVDRVCQQDKIEGWHRNILKRFRRQPEPPVLHPQIIPRKNAQKHSEVILNERVDLIRRLITKRRTRYELDIELDNFFVKRTKSGALSCVPNSQIFNRIGAIPVDEEEPLIPEPTPEPSPAPIQEVYYYAGPEVKTEEDDSYIEYFNQPEEPSIQEDEEQLSESSDFLPRSKSHEFTQDLKPEIVRHSLRQPIKSSKYATSPIDMGQQAFPTATSINRIPRLIQSTKPAGVAIVSAKKHREFRKAKPGRPSNKEKRRLERKAAAELKKQSKRTAKHPTEEIDMNACHCLCRKPFDVKKFYMACNKCFRWFHGRCVGLTEKRASRMATWECPECNPTFITKVPSRPSTQRAKSCSNDTVNVAMDDSYCDADPIPTEDIVNDYLYPRSVYCRCRQAYIETEFYVGCEYCDNWFHPTCVGITRAAAEKMDEYICPNCTLPDPDILRLSPHDHRIVFHAIVALFKVPGNELFRRDTEAGHSYREACPNFPVLEDFCHRHNDFGYAQLADFNDDLEAFESAVHSFFGNRSHHGSIASKMIRIAKRRLQAA